MRRSRTLRGTTSAPGTTPSAAICASARISIRVAPERIARVPRWHRAARARDAGRRADPGSRCSGGSPCWCSAMAAISRVEVTPDGEGRSRMRALRCWLLTRALWDGLAGMRERRGEHDPGRVVGDLAVMLADGGDCLADLRAVRDQQPLFGKVAADATAWRVIDAIAADPQLPAGLRGARARGRGNAWNAGARPERMVIDIDAALITVHSEKDGPAGNFKGGFGFRPLLTYLDESREALGWRAAAGQRRRQHRLRPHRGGRPRARAAPARRRRAGADGGAHRQRRRDPRVHRRAARRP